MTKRIKIAVILVSVAMFALMVTGIGLTAAIWTTGGATGDGNSVGASVKGVDWNLYAKYFSYHLMEGEGASTYYITRFNGVEDGNPYGLNLSVLIIPSNIDISDNSYDLPLKTGAAVVEIRNSIFADTVLKELVVELYIPNSIKRIEEGAFMGMPNLEKVVFADGTECEVGDYAFAACPKLTAENIIDTGANITWREGNPKSNNP